MSGNLHLLVVTPNGVLVDDPSVSSIRLRDDVGSLGLLPRHADLVSVMPASVVQWRDGADEPWRHVAITGGVLRVFDGSEVHVACREGLVGDRIDELVASVRAWREAERELDHQARVQDARLQAAVLRQIVGTGDRPVGPLS